MCTLWMQYLSRPGGGTISPRTWVNRHLHADQNVCWEPNTGPVQERQVLWTQPTLRPPNHFFFFKSKIWNEFPLLPGEKCRGRSMASINLQSGLVHPSPFSLNFPALQPWWAFLQLLHQATLSCLRRPQAWLTPVSAAGTASFHVLRETLPCPFPQ